MEPSAVLLIVALGAIAVLLMLYVHIFIFERKLFFILWFIGWLVIALNYAQDAFYPGLLRQNRTAFLLSLALYFYAHLTIARGTMLFLKRKAKAPVFYGIGAAWTLGFALLAFLFRLDTNMIGYTYLSVFALTCWVGVAMMRSVKRFGRYAFVLGLLNIAWVANTFTFSYILKMPEMAPYYVSHALQLFTAIGLIQMFFKGQQEEIARGSDHIAYLTYHDDLTGLANKPYFDRKLQELAKDAAALPISLLVGDMNGLKFVNDVFGHQAGDHWLKRIAALIQQSCRPGDIIARWGGDEFAIIFPNTDCKTALGIGETIKAACKSDRETDVLLSISLGVAAKTDMIEELSDVLKAAEERMYEFKLIEGKTARTEIAANLVQVLEKRGYETAEHIERMESLAVAFAGALHLSRETLTNLTQAVKLHDIGKIGIPPEIVLKQGALDDAEWAVMKKHVEVGYRVAHASDEFAHLADGILYHHEWWNGQGYRKLKEEEIPLLARIISILDAYDVMTHAQPYKPARTAEEALSELKRMAGVQFDPYLAEVFAGMAEGTQTQDHL